MEGATATDILTCGHCGEKVMAYRMGRHLETCWDGPAGEPVMDFIRSLSVDGEMPTRELYDEKRDKRMPSGKRLVNWFGGWKALQARLGLQRKAPKLPEAIYREQQVDRWCGQVVAVERAVREYEQLRANSLHAIEDDWQTRVFSDNGRIYQEQYVTLR